MSSSPLTSLSRLPAQLASLLGTIFTPYFLSKPSTEAMTTLAQSVSGTKPMRTASFWGLSEPAAWTATCRPGNNPLALAPAAACRRWRRVIGWAPFRTLAAAFSVALAQGLGTARSWQGFQSGR